MGRRFLRLAANVSGDELLIAASEPGAEVHLATCFGLAAGVFGIDAATAAAAYLQQSMTTLVSACQRLLPLGQTQAHQILWDLKPAIHRCGGARRHRALARQFLYAAAGRRLRAPRHPLYAPIHELSDGAILQSPFVV